MDQEPLMLSGLQHYVFCPRQWALIHIEQQWAENVHTVEGNLFHARAHDEKKSELRGDTLIVRGLRIRSERLNVTGICDVVEFHRDANGIELHGRDGRWSVYPVEYKKGAPKEHQADELQLCGQAMCLEEMLMCHIPEGSLYYGEKRRRTVVSFTNALRQQVEASLLEMADLMEKGYTPKVKPHKGCTACSLKDVCVPLRKKTVSVHDYLQEHLDEQEVLL